MLNRDYYIEKLEYYADDPRIKTIVGVRGAGKTSIFQQTIKRLKETSKADNEHIIYINFEYLEFEILRDNVKLKEYILKKINTKERYYIFLDEIQYVPNFEVLLKYFWLNESTLSFYISSSNSRVLRSDLSDELKCKCICFFITPFAFSETCEILHTDIKDKAMLLNYLKYGGFPGRFRFKKSLEVKDYLYSVLDSCYLRDIVMRLGVNEIQDLNYVVRYVTKYLGQKFAPYLVKVEAENEYDMPQHIFENCLDSLCKSLVVQESYGYNVHNNRILYGTFRYYIADFGFAFINGFDLKENMDGALKNLVWLELKRKGYEIYTGIKVDENETIDMVAIYKKRIMYIQVVHLFEDGNAVNQQIAKFDGFEALGPKYILSLDKRTFARNGIVHRNIIDFLLDKSIDIEIEEKIELK